MIALPAEITQESKMKMLAALPSQVLMLSMLEEMRCQKAITVPERGGGLELEFGATTLNSRQDLLWRSTTHMLA